MSKDEIKPGEQLTLAQINRIRKQAQDRAARSAGPTAAEFVAAGYLAENYPPKGFESRSTPEEIAAAVAEQAGQSLSADLGEGGVVELNPGSPIPGTIEETNDGRVPEAEQRKQLIAELKERGIKFSTKAPTEELRALAITPTDE